MYDNLTTLLWLVRNSEYLRGDFVTNEMAWMFDKDAVVA
jgi:hypothetical protein